MIDRPTRVAKEITGTAVSTFAEKLDLAISFASKCHKDQVDKIGEPYILHPLRIMMVVEKGSFSHKKWHMLTAILHDTIEDAPQWWDTAEGSRLRFELPEPVLKSIHLLSQDEDEDYEEYILRIKKSKDLVAYQIKILDIRDNLNSDRLSQLPEKVQIRLRKKYHRALDILDAR